MQEVRRYAEDSGSLLGNQFTAMLIQGTELMQHVGEIPDATADDIQESVSTYVRADRVLDPYKRVMDIWTSEHFGNTGARAFVSTESATRGADQLIKGDYSSFSRQDQEKIRVAADVAESWHFFHWELEFPEVFYDGARERTNSGFDAIIANPPYGAQFPKELARYLQAQYETFVWRGESYLLFVEKAVFALKQSRLLGYVVPDTYLNLGFTQSLRTLLLQQTSLHEIALLPSSAFSGASVDTTILITERAGKAETYHDSEVSVKTIGKKSVDFDLSRPDHEFKIPTSSWYEQQAFNVQSDGATVDLLTRIERQSKRLSELSTMFYGIKAYQVGKGNPPQTPEVRDNKPFTSETRTDSAFLPFFDGKHVGRYELFWEKNNWLKYGPWLAEPRQPEKFEGEKILIRKIVGDTLIANYVPHTSYCNTLLFVLKLNAGVDPSYLYILGLLNSRFLGWYFRQKFQISAQDTFPQIMIRDILQFPIPNGQKALHNQVSKSVKEILTLHEARLETERSWLEWVDAAVPKADRLTRAFREHGWVEVGLQDGWEGVKAVFQTRRAVPDASTTRELRRETEQALEELLPLHERIEATDRLIDQIVYRLYGLTEEEISVVEESLKNA